MTYRMKIQSGQLKLHETDNIKRDIRERNRVY